MTASLATALIDLGLRSSLLLVLAMLAAQAFRGASPEARYVLWTSAFASLALLPFLTALLPSVTIALPIEGAATSEASQQQSASLLGAADAIVLIYALGAAGLVTRLVIGQGALARLWNRAAPLDHESLTLAHELAARHRLSTKVTLRVGSECPVPITWGVSTHKILLPISARDWPPQRLREVLLHEFTHAAHKDSLVRTCAALVCALYWFNPLVWFAFSRMRVEQELACDDRVVRDGASPISYARTLLDVASGIGTPQLIANLAAPMAATSDLERRLKWIVRDGARRVPTRAAKVAASGLVLLAAACAAAADPIRAPVVRPTEATTPQPPTPPDRPTPATPALPPIPAVPPVPPVPELPPTPPIPQVPPLPPAPERTAPLPHDPAPPVRQRTRDSP